MGVAQEGRRDFWLMANWGSIIPLVGVEPLRITPTRCRWDHRQHWTPQRLDEEHGAVPWTLSTESCVHVTPGAVATEEDVRAPRRPTTGPRSYSGPIGKLLKSDQLHLTPLNHHFTPLHLAEHRGPWI